MVRAARMVRTLLAEILNAVVLSPTSAAPEPMSVWITRIKSISCGAKNRKPFLKPISFQLGGQDRYPTRSLQGILNHPPLFGFLAAISVVPLPHLRFMECAPL